MTLVVYANNRFYADDLALVDHKSINLQVRHGVKKVQLIGSKEDKKKEVAIAVCGPFPWEKNWGTVRIALRRIAYYSDQGLSQVLDIAFDTQELYDAFLSISNILRGTTYMFATKTNLYRLDKDGLSVLNRTFEYAHGSGQLYYGICRKAGLTVEQSYAQVAKYERTVGKLECNIDLSELTDLVENVVTHMRKNKQDKLADKIQRTSNRAKMEKMQ